MPRTAAAKKPAAAAPPPPVAKAQKFVTVACKVPCGLEIYLNRKESYDEETMQGSRQRVRYVPTGKAVIIRGPAQPNGQAPRGYVRPTVSSGYALTPGVDAEWFEKWMDQNKLNPLVTEGMIFAHGSRSGIQGWARENDARLSGLEPINPDGDIRMPKSLAAAVGKVETADEMKARQPLPPADDEDFED